MSESKHRYGFIITDYTVEEIDEIRFDWRGHEGVRIIIGPDNFTMIWFDNEEDRNWFLVKWK